MQRGLVGSEMCIRDRYQRRVHGANKKVIELHAKLSALNIKHEQEVYELQMSITKDIEEVYRKCEENKQLALKERDKQIEDLQRRLSQVETEGSKASLEHYSLCALQTENTSLKKSLDEIRLQLHLNMSERKYLQEGAISSSNMIKDLQNQLELLRQSSSH
eukprot:TRINITY_DN4242_c0_g1_i3.p2 TRINITY_DN4242_c0_g1~~TRINITY_DN4242_c0_g1_i3.p2  ORF type:complete len:161 (+),score=45.63 TRINITY_DN4242_c0_g1_i3:151-633(+)